ncbi:Starch-binding associating with outer membrane [bacterium A37T11]|nr:Starch-binding associating with outer membrane [bacterium A37T11]
MKSSIYLLGMACLITACSKFDEINSNPDATEKVTSAMLATKLILDVAKSSSGKSFAIPNVLTKHLVWGENGDAYQYNSFDRTTMDYSILTNVQKMVDVAGDDEKNAYKGLGLFIKAYKLFYMSLDVGDIPYSEALQGEQGLTTPKYDTQKEVMTQVLADLESADNAFMQSGDFSGDPIFGGKSDLWRRTTNAFRLKVLLHLSNKESDGDLSIKDKFKQVISEGFLLQDNSENFQLKYSEKENQYYPFNKTIHKFTEYPMITGFLIDSLKKFNDYRLFYYANPSAYQINTAGKSASDYDAYLGVDLTAVFSDLKALWTADKFCLLNLRYTDYIIGEPLVRIGYAEQNFMIAEAIVRGWIDGDAKSYYDKGIEAAMQFVANNTPDEEVYHHNRKITSDYISTYLNGSYVRFANNATTQIHQIQQQKYFMRFMQNPYEAYYEYRRTGYPNWPVDPATNLNEVKDKIPVRWMYPLNEYTRNGDNVNEAVQRQYNGQDTPNELMWILTK